MYLYFGILFLVILIVITIIKYDLSHFHMVHYHITSHKINQNFRFIVVSDLHNKRYGEDNQSLVEAIEKEKPDAVFIAGDLLTAVENTDYTVAVDFLKQISDKFPVYYGFGNHESRLELYPEKFLAMSQDYSKKIRNTKATILRNKNYYDEDRNINIYGVEIDRSYYKRFQEKPMESNYLEGLLGNANPANLNILIAHNPSYFGSYLAWGADIVLSGHVHGGIARIPFLGGVIAPSLQLFPKYDGGMFQEREGVMILSRGLGNHTLPVRFLNRGECVCVDVLPKKK